ncbi:MAG: HupE/UreJ family protein [Acidobacteriota bacterium]
MIRTSRSVSQSRIRGGRWLATIALLLVTTATSAHQTPFSYVDLRLGGDHIEVTLSGHIVDMAHELSVAPPEVLLSGPLPPAMDSLLRTLQSRLDLRTETGPLACQSTSTAQQLPATQALRWAFACDGPGSARELRLAGPLFPYDPEHQTFVNVYIDDALAGQATLDRSHRSALFRAGTTMPRLTTVRRFLWAGVQHILSGPDHLLFLAGLLLTGGGLGRLVAIVTAFTIAHSVTLCLAVVGVVVPPPRLIEPLIALSIVYVGLRNLRAGGASGARDWRTRTAALFGLIHGFGFAYALREMAVARRDLAWSLLSFNLGVEIGQIAVVLVVATLLIGIRRSGLVSERHLVVAGSSVVAAAGTFWLIERLVALW